MKNKILTRRWLKYYIIIFVSTFSFIFIFNYLIDPYGKQNSFCEIKYKPVLNERGQKFNYIFTEGNIEKYDSVILGSSRVMKISPSSSILTKGFYNFGVHVANNSEKLFLLEEWLKVKKLEKVYLGVEYYNFHENKKPLYVNKNNFKNNYNTNYLSTQTLKLSYKSFINMINDKPITFFNTNGSINYFNKEVLISNNSFNFTTKKFKNSATSHLKNNMINDPFKIEEKVFDVLLKIQELSEKYDFELYVFITPMQSEFLNQLDNHKNILTKFDYIDKRLLDIFGKLYKFNLNDRFNKNTKNFYDPFHYRENLGLEIINRLNNKGQFGTILYKKEKLNAL